MASTRSGCSLNEASSIEFFARTAVVFGTGDPGSYYSYIADGRVIDAIASHIERYETAVTKQAAEFEAGIYEELTSHDG